jgi:hypothetical protein
MSGTASLSIPLQPVPWQTVNVTLNNQAVSLNIYSRGAALYIDVGVGSQWILYGVLCLNNNAIVRSGYFGLIGDLAFQDQQGSSDPTYDGLGTRYLLIYMP